MVYYELIARDPQLSCYLFSEDDPRGRRVVRPQYKPFVCPRCGKVDELRALAQAGVPQMTFRSGRSVVSTCDDFKLCDQRLIDGLGAAGISGLVFLPLDAPQGYFVVLPTARASVDEPTAGMVTHGERCVLCARWRETTVGPLCESIEKPPDERAIFSPAVWSESILGVRPMFLCAAPVAKAVSSQKFSGLELARAF
ncbi:hypothetical protein LJR118_003333 [Acidovorax sp. LjRoot118]|uniref:hypothetical protein n=1 Tax=Acidovorax sp. LjRoot118 TaxID=3342256 RepID=UPI003ECCA62B